MRLFFCLELEQTLKQQIYKDFSHLRRSAVKVGWVKPDNLHVTLKFLGEIEPSQIGDLKVITQRVIEESGVTTPIRTALNTAGFFPNPNKPRVVWIGPADQPIEIVTLAENLSEHLEKIGFNREQKPFITHVTLGRVKEQGKAVEELVQLMKRTPAFEYTTTFEYLTLMESELTPHGSIYRPVFQIPFA